MGRIGYPIGAALGALTSLLVGPAGAQEFCVACSEPNAVYRCVIDGAKPGGGQSLQMLCVTTLAREGRHATCGVKRGTVFDCDGPVKRVPWVALNSAPPSDGAQAPPQPASGAPRPEPSANPAPTPAPAPEGPPQTMVELAKRANEQTVQQMKKAGDTVKEATKKTWDCMVSLFTRC